MERKKQAFFNIDKFYNWFTLNKEEIPLNLQKLLILGKINFQNP